MGKPKSSLIKSFFLEQSRRQFLENSLKGAALLSLAAHPSISRAATPLIGIGQRRHLINFMVWGGIDTLWWYNNVPSNFISDITRIYQAGMNPDNGAITTLNGQTFRNPDSNILAPYLPRSSDSIKWDIRHPDSFLTPHPVTPNAFLGAGFKNRLQSEDLQSLLFIRGISQVGGGHFLGNRYIQTGTSGKSTPCFSAVIAQHLASHYVRPLHYVQIANNPDELYNQPGNLLGPAIPIQIPNENVWNQITNLNQTDLPMDRRAALTATLSKLSNDIGAGRLKKATSKTLFSSFFDSYQSAYNMSTGDHSAFAPIHEHYKQFLAGLLGPTSTHPFRNWFAETLLSNGVPNPGLQYQFNALAFQLAMAEYLVANDLSAVVDIPTIPLDFHNDLGGECGRVLGIMMGYVELMRRLKTYQVGSTGKSVFDCTTLVLHSEFDRTAYLYNEGTNYRLSGSGHWEGYTSMILAGSGVNSNRMIGGYMTSSTAPNSPYQGLPFQPHTGLPIHPFTGQIDTSSSGKKMTTEQIFPTLLSLFGCLELSPLPTMPSSIGSAIKSAV